MAQISSPDDGQEELQPFCGSSNRQRRYDGMLGKIRFSEIEEFSKSKPCIFRELSY